MDSSRVAGDNGDGNGNPDPDERGSGPGTDKDTSNEIEVVELETLQENPGGGGSGLRPDRDRRNMNNNQVGGVDAPMMEVDEVIVVNEVEITLSDTDPNSSQGGDSDLDFLPQSSRRAAEEELSSSDVDDDGGGRRGRGQGQRKRRRKSSAGTGEPFVKQKTVSVQKLNVLRDEDLIEGFNHYWICEECGAFFKDKEKLRSHLKTHLKRYFCKLCPESGSHFATLEELKKHIGRRHEGDTTRRDTYSLQNAPGLDEAEVNRKTDKSNFLTVEQLRNRNREKYDELKNLPVVTLQELMGNEEIEDDETPTTSGVTVTAGSSSSAPAFAPNEDYDDNERPPIIVDEIQVEPGASHQTPKIREKRKSAMEAQNKIVACRLLGEDLDYNVKHPPEGKESKQRPASRNRGSGGEKKNETEVDVSKSDKKEEEKAKGPDEAPPGSSVMGNVGVAGPSHQVDESENRISERSERQEASLTLTPDTGKDSEEKSESNDNAAVEGKSAEDGVDASSEDAPRITGQDQGIEQSFSGTGGFPRSLPEIIRNDDEESVAGEEAAMAVVNQEETETEMVAETEVSSIASVREAAASLTEDDNKEKLKKKKKKVKVKDGKRRQVPPRRESLPRSWKPAPAPE